MSSVFVFPRLDLARTAELLAGLGSPNGQPWEWVIDGNLYVRVEEPPNRRVPAIDPPTRWP